MRNLYPLLFVLFMACPVLAEQVAVLHSKSGIVERSSGSAWHVVDIGETLQAGQTIRTGAQSRAGLRFSDGVMLRMRANSILRLSGSKGGSGLFLQKGAGHFFRRERGSFPEVQTPVVSAAVRGTEFVVEASTEQSTVSVLEGAVDCRNEHGSLSLRPREQAVVRAGRAPVRAILVNPLDAVQWAIRYPVMVADQSYVGSGKRVLAALGRKGDPQSALSELGSDASPQGQLLRAQLMVALGEINAARLPKVSDLPSSSLRAELYALQSVLGLAVNRKGEALAHAEAGLGESDQSQAARYARGLVAQAQFDLEGARHWFERAAAVPGNQAALQGKLAEILLAMGREDQAWDAVERALTANSSDPFALAVQGFLELRDFRPQQAQTSFEKALASDSEFGLAHLGRGLSRINQGELAAGRSDIALAAALEPNVAVYRSYLGKAFFEEEDEEFARKEYERAIALDPEDPTPYLYRAYADLAENDPIGALRDVERSIARNENRAVYRSSLGLDRDAAVRSAGLAEVFSTLGFEQAARIEAVKSIHQSYTNYSGHRLLADSSDTLLLNDAQVSENKIASLLAPLSFNLSQNPGGDISLNEYNALFDRPDQRTELEFRGTTVEDQLSPLVRFSGRTERSGYFLEHNSDYTGGDRDENYRREQQVRSVLQHQFNSSTRVTAAGRYQYRAEEDAEAAFDDTKTERVDADLGLHQRLGDASLWISQFSYRNGRRHFGGFDERFVDLMLTSLGEGELLDDRLLIDEFFRDDVEDYRLSSQYVVETDNYAFITGGQLYRAEPEREDGSTVIDDDFSVFTDLERRLSSSSDQSLNSQDWYSYLIWHGARWIDFTLAVDYTHLEQERRELPPFLKQTLSQSRWNPKIGTTIYLGPDTTVRAAYFEGLRKSALEDVGSIEPTLVGGINTTFTDFSGSRARSYAVGIDHKFAGSTYAGVEFMQRRVSEPENIARETFFFDFDALGESSTVDLISSSTLHQDQNFLSAYFYQVLTDRVSATLDYLWSEFEQTDPGANQDIESHKIATGVRYFNSSGWFSFLDATWRDQERRESFFFDDGSSDFWVFDAGMGYRFPKRHGSVVLQATNIFDRKFNYDQSFGVEEIVFPEVGGEIRVRLSF